MYVVADLRPAQIQVSDVSAALKEASPSLAGLVSSNDIQCSMNCPCGKSAAFISGSFASTLAVPPTEISHWAALRSGSAINVGPTKPRSHSILHCGRAFDN